MPASKQAVSAAKVANAAAKAVLKEASKAAGSEKPARVQAPPKLHPVSLTLKNFLGGVAETNRADALKQVWVYIKDRGLQDPENRREIVVDSKLKVVLGKDRVKFTEIPGLLNPHFPKKEGKKS